MAGLIQVRTGLNRLGQASLGWNKHLKQVQSFTVSLIELIAKDGLGQIRIYQVRLELDMKVQGITAQTGTVNYTVNLTVSYTYIFFNRIHF